MDAGVNTDMWMCVVWQRDGRLPFADAFAASSILILLSFILYPLSLSIGTRDEWLLYPVYQVRYKYLGTLLYLRLAVDTVRRPCRVGSRVDGLQMEDCIFAYD